MVLADKAIYIQQFNGDLWAYIGATALFGLIGGFGFMIVSDRFIPPYWVKDQNDNKISFVFGTLKELPAGAIGGVITTLGFFGGINLVYAMHIALITGIGSTSYLVRYLNKHHQLEYERLQNLETQPIEDYEDEDIDVDTTSERENESSEKKGDKDNGDTNAS